MTVLTYTLFLLKVCEFDKSFTLQATQVDQNGNSQRKKEFTALLKQVSSFDNGVKKNWSPHPKMLLLAQGSCMFSLVYELVGKTLPLKNSFIFIHAAVQFYDAPPKWQGRQMTCSSPAAAGGGGGGGGGGWMQLELTGVLYY